MRTLTEEEKQERVRKLTEANKDAEEARRMAEEEGKRRASANKPARVVVTKRIYVRDRRLALHQIHVLLTAFEEVADYNPLLRHNGPPPALWISDEDSTKGYLKDVKELLAELKQLNEFLKVSSEISAPKPAEAVSAVKTASSKFLDSWAEGLGKGAAALSIMAVTALLLNLGVGKELLGPVLAKLGK